MKVEAAFIFVAPQTDKDSHKSIIISTPILNLHVAGVKNYDEAVAAALKIQISRSDRSYAKNSGKCTLLRLTIYSTPEERHIAHRIALRLTWYYRFICAVS